MPIFRAWQMLVFSVAEYLATVEESEDCQAVVHPCTLSTWEASLGCIARASLQKEKKGKKEKNFFVMFNWHIKTAHIYGIHCYILIYRYIVQ